MVVRIRPAHQGEAALLGSIGFAAWASSPLCVADNGRTDQDRLRALFASFCAEGWQTIRVADGDGVPLGWGARENGDNYISDLWIGPEAQGQGAGLALLSALETQIRAAGHDTAELETGAVNAPALRFYRRNGYCDIWRGEMFDPALGYGLDKRRLSKRLSD